MHGKQLSLANVVGSSIVVWACYAREIAAHGPLLDVLVEECTKDSLSIIPPMMRMLGHPPYVYIASRCPTHVGCLKFFNARLGAQIGGGERGCKWAS